MPASRFNRLPMLWLAVAFGIGIFSQSAIPIDLRITAAIAAVLAAAAIFLRSHFAATIFILTATVLAGSAAAKVEIAGISTNRIRVIYDSGAIPSGDPVELEGVLLGRPEASVDGYLLTLSVENIKHRNTERTSSGNVRLFLRSPNDPGLRFGSRIRVSTKLERDDGYLNPGVMPSREILDRMQIDASGAIKSPLLVEKLAEESVFIPLAWVYDQRAAIIESFRRNLSPPAAGVMIASLLGNREFLDKETADLFRDGGVFHILVISGLHITFFGGFLLWILRKITAQNWILFSVTNLILWAYTLAVGADVPVVRAALMFTVMSFAYILHRRASLLNSLGISVLILLAWRPSDLFNPSFQLTFVSVAAIVAIAFPLLEMIKRIGRWTPTPEEPFPPSAPHWLVRLSETFYWNEKAWEIESRQQIWKAKISKSRLLPVVATPEFQFFTRPVFEGILVSLVVLICMLPLSIVYFHRVAMGSIVLNLWVGFFIALESFAAVTAVMIGSISETFANGFFALAEVSNWLMLLLPKLVPVSGWLSFRLPAYSGNGRLIYVLFLPILVLLALAIDSWRPFDIGKKKMLVDGRIVATAAASLCLLILLAILHPFAAPRPDGLLRIDFLDVGQGDSALITFPDGKTMLVDGGGRRLYREDSDEPEFIPDSQAVGETVVSPFLWNRGLSRIDYLLATHGDADHIQGLIDVAKNFEIGTAILGREPLQTVELAEFSSVLARRGIPVEYVAAGDTFRFGEVIGEVLNPSVEQIAARSTNDTSVVLRLTFRERSVLLTGDIEQTAEGYLSANPTKIKSDVVKVAHHGSRTSSTQSFVDATTAKIAVIPVGRISPHGHPHAEVVRRWETSGAQTITTGSRGTVTITTDGKDLQMATYR